MPPLSRQVLADDAKLATLRDENDEPIGQFPIVDLMVPPGIVRRSDRLEWTAGPDFSGWRLVRPQRELLSQFVGLGSDRSGDAIEAFAQKWGVLGICRHELPASHRPAMLSPRLKVFSRVPLYRRVAADVRRMCEVQGLTRESDRIVEGLHVWRSLSGEAARLVKLATRINAWEPGQRAPLQDSDFLGGRSSWEPSPKSDLTSPELQAAREVIAGSLDVWLRIANVRLRVATTESDYRADHESAFGPDLAWMIGSEEPSGVLKWRGIQTLAVGRLFQTLALQLLAATTAILAPFVCAGCRSLIWTERRRPQRGYRSFCKDCRAAKVPQKIASAESRARPAEVRAANLERRNHNARGDRRG